MVARQSGKGAARLDGDKLQAAAAALHRWQEESKAGAALSGNQANHDLPLVGRGAFLGERFSPLGRREAARAKAGGRVT